MQVNKLAYFDTLLLKPFVSFLSLSMPRLLSLSCARMCALCVCVCVCVVATETQECATRTKSHRFLSQTSSSTLTSRALTHPLLPPLPPSSPLLPSLSPLFPLFPLFPLLPSPPSPQNIQPNHFPDLLKSRRRRIRQNCSSHL